MDLLDARILRSLYWNPFNPVDLDRGPLGVWDIARALGVHGNTVKRRLGEMEASGVLRGLSFFPNALLLGLRVGFYSFVFKDAESCNRAAQSMFARSFPGVSIQYAHPEVRFNLPVPADQDPDAAAAAWADEHGAVSWTAITYRHWESDPLTDLEERVLKTLHKDLFATPPDMASELGVTPKTVRRCIESLREKKTFCIVPLVDQMAVTGLQASMIDVEVGDDQAAERQVWAGFPDLLPNGIHGAGQLILLAMLETPQDLSHVLQELRSIPGVKQAVAHLPLRMQWNALPTGLQRVSEVLLQEPPMFSATE